MKTPNGDNLEINMNLQVNGEKLTGTVTNTYGEEQITEGAVIDGGQWRSGTRCHGSQALDHGAPIHLVHATSATVRWRRPPRICIARPATATLDS